MAAEDLKQVNMHDAKTHLSRLVEEVEGGREIVISRAGKPAVKLVPIVRPQPGKRVLGTLRGKIALPSDEEWAAIDREIEQDFEESEVFPTGDRLWRED